MKTSKTHRIAALVGAAFLTLFAWRAAHAAPPPPPAPSAATAASKDTGAEKAPPLTGAVNLNTATEEDLMRLPGVGPSKAAAVVAWRKKHGNFGKIDDLGRVKGFGRKTLVKLKPNLSVNGPTTIAGSKTVRHPSSRTRED